MPQTYEWIAEPIKVGSRIEEFLLKNRINVLDREKLVGPFQKEVEDNSRTAEREKWRRKYPIRSWLAAHGMSLLWGWVGVLAIEIFLASTHQLLLAMLLLLTFAGWFAGLLYVVHLNNSVPNLFVPWRDEPLTDVPDEKFNALLFLECRKMTGPIWERIDCRTCLKNAGLVMMISFHPCSERRFLYILDPESQEEGRELYYLATWTKAEADAIPQTL